MTEHHSFTLKLRETRT